MYYVIIIEALSNFVQICAIPVPKKKLRNGCSWSSIKFPSLARSSTIKDLIAAVFHSYLLYDIHEIYILSEERASLMTFFASYDMMTTFSNPSPKFYNVSYYHGPEKSKKNIIIHFSRLVWVDNDYGVIVNLGRPDDCIVLEVKRSAFGDL